MAADFNNSCGFAEEHSKTGKNKNAVRMGHAVKKTDKAAMRIHPEQHRLGRQDRLGTGPAVLTMLLSKD